MKKQSKTPKFYYYAQVKGPLSINETDFQVEFEVQKIVDHRIKQNYHFNYLFDSTPFSELKLMDIPNNQLQFLVKWKGYGSEDESWEPGENMQNAPQIVQSYKSNYSNSMPGGKSTTHNGRARGRKPKVRQVVRKFNGKPTRNNRGLKFDKIYQENGSAVKQSEEDSDELCIIDKATYIKETMMAQNIIPPPLKSNKPQHKEQQESQEEQSPLQPQISLKSQRKQNQQDAPECGSKLPTSKGQIIDNSYQDCAVMPESYCQMGANAAEQPSHSLSSVLNQQDFNKSKFQQNNIEVKPTQKYIIQPGSYQEQSQNIQNKQLICENQAPIINHQNQQPQNIKETAANMLQSQHKESFFAVNQLSRIMGKGNQNHDIISYEINQKQLQQDSNKRQQIFEFTPEETGERIYKKRKLNCEEAQIVIQDDEVQQASNTKANITNQTNSFLNKTITQNGNLPISLSQITQFLPVNLDPQNTLGEKLIKHSLKQKIQAELKSLLQIQPISLQDDSSQEPNYGFPLATIQQSKPDKQRQNQFQCNQCQKVKQSFQLLVQYLKYYIESMNQANANLNLDKIYEQQQTFVLVNGLNPNYQIDKSDRVKKLIVLENKSYIQNVILKNEANIQEINTITTDYKLSKIVLANNEWFGVFKTEKLLVGRKHYYYVKMRYLAQSYKTIIEEYLTSKN